MKLFLDTSVLLAACGSTTGASRAVFNWASPNGWRLQSSRYCVAEAAANLFKLGAAAALAWSTEILPTFDVLDDETVFNKPLALSKGKDKPVLITALAHGCDCLLTLDRKDFGPFMTAPVYGLHVYTPAAFLVALRKAGRLME